MNKDESPKIICVKQWPQQKPTFFVSNPVSAKINSTETQGAMNDNM